MRLKKGIVLGDTHIPLEDKRAVKLVLKLLGDIGVEYDEIHLCGDLIEVYDLSRFRKNPALIGKTKEAIERTEAFIAEVRERQPKAKIWYEEGNHERRLNKAVWDKPEFWGLRGLSWRVQLNLDKYKCEYVPAHVMKYIAKNFIVTHGSNEDGGVLRKHAGYSAKGNIEKLLLSGISGHSHRLGSSYLATPYGMLSWFENGCLCDADQMEYTVRPNWELGFSTYWRDGEQVFVQQHPIIDYRCVVNGKVYRA